MVNTCAKDVVCIPRVTDSMIVQWTLVQKVKLSQWMGSVKIVEMDILFQTTENLATSQIQT